jgi:DNA polymerase-3 subunit gamma/tau
MNEFIVSARKYRPQNFNTVVGQQHITTTLKNAIKTGQLAHAFLFCGPRGVGKTTCARILAKTINCENLQPDGEACNECHSCKSFEEGTSLNIHELDAASNNSVDDIRALVEQVRFAPQAGKYKIYIVDEVHMLSASAFNAFLKTLEEPPSYAKFILATTEKHKILPTILSRCQIFDFKRITSNDTVEHLAEIIANEHIQAEKAALQVIAQKSEGCMRDALSILDKIVSFTGGTVTYQNTLENLNILDEDYFFKLIDALLTQNLADTLLLFDEINRKGFEGDIVLNGFATCLRNVLVCKDARALQLLDVVAGMEEKYKSYAQKISTAFLVSALQIINEAEVQYKMARNKRLHVEMMLIKINYLQQAIEITSADGFVAKKKRLDGPIAIATKSLPSLTTKASSAEAVNSNAAAKLYIETPAAASNRASATAAPTDTEVATPAPTPAISGGLGQQAPSGGSKPDLLALLQQHTAARGYTVSAVKQPQALTAEKLRAAWDAYAQNYLANTKLSAFAAFQQAELIVESDIRFMVRTNSHINKNFIESEKTMLSDFIQQSFTNINITFGIEVNASDVVVNIERPLSNRERYEQLAAQYPTLRALKEGLRLEIE